MPEEGALLLDPVHVWLVTDGKRRILVDTGMPDIAEVSRKLKVDGAGGGHSHLRQALGEAGITPEQIDTVIVTHLHYDHGCNLDLFPNACIVVQRDELSHAMDPVPTQRPFYFKESLVTLLGRRRPIALRVVDGDWDLLEGVRILKIPSHTPGMQVPIVTTARGKAALVSDLGDHYKNWFPADKRATRHPLNYLSDTFLPSPLRSEAERVYLQGMARVKAASDIIVPAHDTRLPRLMPRDWFELPPVSQPEPPLIPLRSSEA